MYDGLHCTKLLGLLSVVQCPVLAAPANGQLKSANRNYGGIATFSCNTGYQLQGNSDRQCLANGAWSEQDNTCLSELLVYFTTGAQMSGKRMQNICFTYGWLIFNVWLKSHMFENVWLLGADIANVWLNVWFSGKRMAHRMAFWQTYGKHMPKRMVQKLHICKRMSFLGWSWKCMAQQRICIWFSVSAALS